MILHALIKNIDPTVVGYNMFTTIRMYQPLGDQIT